MGGGDLTSTLSAESSCLHLSAEMKLCDGDMADAQALEWDVDERERLIMTDFLSFEWKQMSYPLKRLNKASQ